MKQAIPVAVAAAGGLLLALKHRRSRRHHRGGQGDGDATDSLRTTGSEASYTDASVDGSVAAAHHRHRAGGGGGGLATLPEVSFGEGGGGTQQQQQQQQWPGWDHWLVVALAVLATAVGVQRQAWDVVSLMAGLLAVLLVRVLLRVWRVVVAKRKARSKKSRRRKSSKRTIAGLWAGWRTSAAAAAREGTPGGEPGEEEEEDEDGEGSLSDDAPRQAPPHPTRPDPRLAGTWIKDGRASDPMDMACDIMQLNGVVRLAVGLVKGIEIKVTEQPALPRVSPAPPPPPATPAPSARNPTAGAAPSAAAPSPPAGAPSPHAFGGRAQQRAGTTATATTTATTTTTTTPAGAPGHAAAWLPSSSNSSRTAGGPSAQPVVVFEMAVFSVIAWFKVREHYQLGGPPGTFNRRDLRRGKHLAVASLLADGGVRLDVEWKPPHGGQGYDEFRLEGDDELHVTSHMDVGGRKHTYTIVYRRKR